MTSKKISNRTQLPLPFHLPVTAPMSEGDLKILKQALAQLLLEAAGLAQEASSDE